MKYKNISFTSKNGRKKNRQKITEIKTKYKDRIFKQNYINNYIKC